MGKKENILSAISNSDILEHYAMMFGYNPSKGNQFISDPRSIKKHQTPSCSIFKKPDGELGWKEWTNGEGGDGFAFVMYVMNCDFARALEIIERDFNIIA
jgi:hypothetical protein